MPKKLFIFIGGLIIIVVAVMFFLSRDSKKTLSPISGKPATSSQSPVTKTKAYSDPSGFKFSYPDNLKLTATDVSTRSALYADLVLNLPGKRGQLAIMVEDTTKTFFDEGLKGKNAIETKLGDMDAYQYLERNKLITTAYDQGVVFTFTADQSIEKKYWFDVNKQVLSSFEFAPPETAAESSGSGGEDEIIYEGEEVIE